jgi:hypothetical protein
MGGMLSASALSQVLHVVHNRDGRLLDPWGYRLPPCIVMERGESLDLWSDRAKPDRSQAFSVCNHIMLPGLLGVPQRPHPGAHTLCVVPPPLYYACMLCTLQSSVA